MGNDTDTPNVDRVPLEDFWTPERKELAAKLRPAIGGALLAGGTGTVVNLDRVTAEVMRVLAEEGLA